MNHPSTTPARVSIRLRFTLWNTGVLALLLTIFAITAWITLRRVLAQRGDATVRESARAIAGAVIAERRTPRARGDTSRVARTAARDVLRELRMGDLDVLIVDDAARVVAANRAPAQRRPGEQLVAPLATDRPSRPRLTVAARAGARSAATGASRRRCAHATLTIDNVTWRAALMRVRPNAATADEPSLVVSVLRSDEEDLAVLARVRTTLLLRHSVCVGGHGAGRIHARTTQSRAHRTSWPILRPRDFPPRRSANGCRLAIRTMNSADWPR